MVGPTGASALNMNGETVHSMFSFPYRTSVVEGGDFDETEPTVSELIEIDEQIELL